MSKYHFISQKVMLYCYLEETTTDRLCSEQEQNFIKSFKKIEN